MRVSVCVATKNRTDMLHQFLWSLIRQEYQDWDLIIVDDSDDPVNWNAVGVYPRLLREINRTGHDIRIAAGPRVNRVGAAYQVGFSVASRESPLFLRVDDDAWLEPDYLVRLTELMKDADVAACGGLFLHPGQEIHCIEPESDQYRHATIDGLSDHANIQWFRHERSDAIRVEHLTANILFNRMWLERIGGFETQLYRVHRDETQASWRLFVEGGMLLVHPRAVAWHLRGVKGGTRGHQPDIYLEDHRTFMAQRKTMKPGIHLSLSHGLGDGLMATPMIAVMREMNPDRNLAVSAPWAPTVLPANPDVDAIAAHPLDAQRTVRLDQSVYRWASAMGWKGHLAEAYCKMLDLPMPKDLTPKLHWTQAEHHEPPRDLEALGPFLVIAPWSTAQTLDLYMTSGTKNWPMERWPSIVSWAHGKGLQVVQLRGSSDEPIVDGADLDLCGRPLREVFRFIERAALLVSVDTMAHHVAAAFHVPSVVLWGRSKPEHFGYRTPRIRNIQGDCPGEQVRPRFGDAESSNGASPAIEQERPCIDGDQWAMDKQVCPVDGHPCMNGISVEAVIEALEKLHERFVTVNDRQTLTGRCVG